MNEEKEIGEVTHYYSHLGVAIVKFNRKVKVGDKIHLKGHTSDFTETISHMQYDHKDIEEAKPGQEVGIKVSEKVRQGDKVCEVV
ncbi:MAG: translation elongation factor-like protein [Candidatus Colwellbacteria bacterium]|nr:translation elongation factor-like protein [Candidatus Colwellbacteria bacterium]